MSDNGPQFVAKEFEEFMLNNGIKHIRSAPYHPATNGLVEHFVQSFKRAMEAMKNSRQTWQHRLSSFLLAYRSTPHTVTNVSPGSLFLQRELRTRLDLLRETTEQIVRKKQEEQKEWHDKSTRERGFEPNNVVCKKFWGRGEMDKRKNKAGFGTDIVYSGVSRWENVETTYRPSQKSRGANNKIRGK